MTSIIDVDPLDTLIRNKYWYIAQADYHQATDANGNISDYWLVVCSNQPKFKTFNNSNDHRSWNWYDQAIPSSCSYFILNNFNLGANVFDPISPTSITYEEYGSFITINEIDSVHFAIDTQAYNEQTAPFRVPKILASNFPLIVSCELNCNYNSKVQSVDYLFYDAVGNYDPPDSGYQYDFDQESDQFEYLNDIIPPYVTQDCSQFTMFEHVSCTFQNSMGTFGTNAVRLFARIFIPNLSELKTNFNYLAEDWANHFGISINAISQSIQNKPSAQISNVNITLPVIGEATIVDFSAFYTNASTMQTIRDITTGLLVVGLSFFSITQFMTILDYKIDVNPDTGEVRRHKL